MAELLTIHLFLNNGTSEQINELKSRINEFNVIAGPSIEDDTVWILTGNKVDLKRALTEVFNVWNGPCPILPEELMSEEDAEQLSPWKED